METEKQRQDLLELIEAIERQLRKHSSMGQIITMLETAMTESQSIYDQES